MREISYHEKVSKNAAEAERLHACFAEFLLYEARLKADSEAFAETMTVPNMTRRGGPPKAARTGSDIMGVLSKSPVFIPRR